MLRVGQILLGECDGRFGRDAYEDKRVEAVGMDWVVARDRYGFVFLGTGNPDTLMAYAADRDEL